MAAALPVRLTISAHHHRALQEHLFPGDGKEAVAFALCGRARRADLELLVVREVIPISHDVCRIRTPHRVAWPGVAMEPILQKAMASGAAVVKVHSHPTGYEWFSDTDDIAEREMFPSVFGWLDTDAPLASLIMLPDGRLVGRAVQEHGEGEPLHGIRIVGDDFVFLQYGDAAPGGELPEHAQRIAQTFGDRTYQLLRNLRVGVVGASGTGSIVIEQLARNCVGELVLVDPDNVEGKNLNRILNSTASDAEEGAHKTAVQERAIAAMRLGTRVQAFHQDLLDRGVLEALSTCDVLFGCMDSVDGRHVLNKLASTYVIPLIDVGVRLDSDGRGGIDSIWAAVHTILPGGSSLLSRRVYSQADLEAAFLRRTDPDAYEHQRKLGYVKGVLVDRPAVISVNMEAASAAVNEFLARVHPYRVLPNGRFAARRMSLSDPDASMIEPDGEPCPVMLRAVGMGDQEPPLGLPLLGRRT
ncbi:ThiF family adenylyltransferase [Paludibacterium sp.]|uniref:HesA/MoeB/ThiF family protein n=1 Tax=Paludibacterium sp. TaxID=1917523 RepID=UPI0025DDACBF|nr:ThiF family adenylyltransferase [Paludibacterium sp.]MBV8646334.1 ThiF family adenylyltransferase [Paludibacterium sp.]